jgi:two-component system, cell cycle sensor histidine kinase and response regulator CckA
MTSYRVLIAEDGMEWGGELASALISAGYEVVGPVAAGEAALRKAARLKPDIAILDFTGKEKIDCIQTTESIRSLCDAAIIYLVDASDLDSMNSADRDQPYCYLTKPIVHDELLRVAETLLLKRSTEKKPGESEERFRRMVETAIEGIWAMDKEFRTTFVNRRMAEMLGYSINEMIGRPVDFFMFEEDLADHAEKMDRRKQGEGQSYERRFRRKDGGTLWTIVSATAQQDNAGEFIGSFAMFTDITERKQAEQSLVESQERLRTIFDASSSAIFLVNAEGLITMANRRMADLFALSHDELPGTPYVDLVHPEQRHIGLSKMRSLMTGEIDHVSLERRYVTSGGRELLGHLSGRRLLREDGSLVGLVGIITDVSDRRRAEEALKESEERYRTLFERAGDGIIVVDIEGEDAGKIVSANRVAAEMHGYNIDEFLRLRMSDLDTPEEARRMAELFTRVNAGETLKTEHHHRKKDGSVVPIELSIGLMEMRGHKYALSINRDISERIKAEAERVLLATAIEQAAESVEITDAQGNVVYVNPAFEGTTGYSRSEIEGKKPGILASGEHDESMYRSMWQTISSGETWTGNLVNKRKDGKLFEEEVTISPVKDESGVILNYVAVKRDVTNEVLLQKQLLEAQKMEAVGTLAGGIAHDFNNLLQVINGFAEVALFDMEEGQSGWTELGEIRRAARSAAELTQGLLTFSRKVESKLRPVNLNQELRSVERILARTLPKMIEIRMDLSEPVDAVNADPAQLQQVIINLAVNARDAMQNGGRLSLETRNVVLDEEYCKSHLETMPGRYVVLSISDTGTGMDAETKRHIFDPFFTTKETGKGTGLGLSIAFGIIKSHGGNILCYSEPEQGTTFKIYLPVSRSELGGRDGSELRTLIGGTETILVVDDEESVRTLAVRLLRKFGYSVLTAVDGKEALEVFSDMRDHIDLIVLDLIMPVMGGRDCLRELLKIAPQAKIIIASGYAANGQVDTALKDGAKTFVRKPYEARQLLEVVRKALDGEYD